MSHTSFVPTEGSEMRLSLGIIPWKGTNTTCMTLGTLSLAEILNCHYEGLQIYDGTFS